MSCAAVVIFSFLRCALLNCHSEIWCKMVLKILKYFYKNKEIFEYSDKIIS